MSDNLTKEIIKEILEKRPNAYSIRIYTHQVPENERDYPLTLTYESFDEEKHSGKFDENSFKFIDEHQKHDLHYWVWGFICKTCDIDFNNTF